MKRKFLIVSILVFVVGIIFYSYVAQFYVVPILMYHRVNSIQHNDSNTVSTENFIRQMKFLHRRGYNVISLEELAEGIKAQKNFPRNSVVITFDDGYEDNYLNAYPHLKKYDFPAIIFLPSDLIGQDKFLKWGQIREMIKNDISFGGHTRAHEYLPGIKNKRKLTDEIFGCKKMIEAKTKQPVYYFCYPVGGFNEEIKKILKEVGYKAACTTNRGFDKFNNDVFELKRVKITDSDANLMHFWIKLCGYYNLFRAPKSPE